MRLTEIEPPCAFGSDQQRGHGCGVLSEHDQIVRPEKLPYVLKASPRCDDARCLLACEAAAAALELGATSGRIGRLALGQRAQLG